MRSVPVALGALSLLFPFLAAGCTHRAGVTLYVAVDQEHSEQMVKRFTAETGIAVDARYDVEANKTVGLVSAIVEEAERPRCDVFWNNELAHTVRLGQKGLLAPYAPKSATAIPAQYRDAGGLWTGFAARGRVLIVNTDLLPDRAQWPTSMWDLVDPKWKGRCGVARPLTGTTLTHFAALQTVLPPERYAAFVDGLFANEVVFLQGNAAAMRQTAAGAIAWAFTDTDDYHVAKQKGQPVACVFPDQGAGQIGTMLIPNSVAIVKGAPHGAEAERLVEWIASEQTEALLAASKSAQIPLRTGVIGPGDPAILAYGKFRGMEWAPAAVAEKLEATAAAFQKRLGQ